MESFLMSKKLICILLVQVRKNRVFILIGSLLLNYFIGYSASGQGYSIYQHPAYDGYASSSAGHDGFAAESTNQLQYAMPSNVTDGVPARSGQHLATVQRRRDFNRRRSDEGMGVLPGYITIKKYTTMR